MFVFGAHFDALQNRELRPWACPAPAAVGDVSNSLCHSALTKDRAQLAATITAHGDDGWITLLRPPASAHFFQQMGEIFLGRQPVPDITLFLPDYCLQAGIVS